MNIIQFPDEVLITSSAKVVDYKRASEIADNLISVIRKLDKPFTFGLGMAAPQIGVSARIIVLRMSYQNYKIMINPEIIEQKWTIITPSKCFSLKGTYLTKAHLWIKVKYYDLDEKQHIQVVTGAKAITLQQEIDHINGKLLHDRGIRIW